MIIIGCYITVTTKPQRVNFCANNHQIIGEGLCTQCQQPVTRNGVVVKNPNHIDVMGEVAHPLHVLTRKVLTHLEPNQWLIYSKICEFPNGSMVSLEPNQIITAVNNFKQHHHNTIKKLQNSPLVKSMELEFGVINLQ